MQAVDLGLLDFGSIRDNADGASALEETAALAQHAERCGYTRYWLAEHHHHRRAWANPTVMVTHLLSRTTRLLVGPAGILLSHYSALAVANDYSLLGHLFAHRAELGIARGFAEGAARALGHAIAPASPTEYERRVEELRAHLLDSLEPDHPHFGAFATPFPPQCPTVWVMGSGQSGARLAGRLGLAYCHSLFHGGSAGENGIDIYHESFQPGPFGAEPQAAIAVAGICLRDRAEAEKALPSAVVHGSGLTANVLGSAFECAAGIHELSEARGVRTVIYLDLTVSREERRDSCIALAAAMGLSVV